MQRRASQRGRIHGLSMRVALSLSVSVWMASSLMGMPNTSWWQDDLPSLPAPGIVPIQQPPVVLLDHKCERVPRGEDFKFTGCLFTAARNPFCTGGCDKGIYLESFRMCKPAPNSNCVAIYTEVRVRITHEAVCKLNSRRNGCDCGEFRRLERPRDAFIRVPMCN